MDELRRSSRAKRRKQGASETTQTWSAEPVFKEAHITSSLKIGDSNVWIRTDRYLGDYLLDSLARKESVKTNLRFRTAGELSRTEFFSPRWLGKPSEFGMLVRFESESGIDCATASGARGSVHPMDCFHLGAMVWASRRHGRNRSPGPNSLLGSLDFRAVTSVPHCSGAEHSIKTPR